MIKVRIPISKRTASLFLVFLFLILLPEKVAANQLICDFSNEDINVNINKENDNTVIIKAERLKEGIDNIKLHLNPQQMGHISNIFNESQISVHKNEIIDISSEQLTIVFTEKIPFDFVDHLSYISNGKINNVKPVFFEEQSTESTFESTFNGSTQTTTKEEEVEMQTDILEGSVPIEESTFSSDTEEEEVQNSSQDNTNLSDESKAIQKQNKIKLGGGSEIIPEGGILINGLFEIPSGSNGFVINNIDPDNTINNGQPYSEITIGGQNNWVAMWSLENNLLDFSHSFKGRMYVNFGSNQTDGFTFTIHNDPAKTRAVTSAQNIKTDGQNLGVYGTNTASRNNYPNTNAIKNSFTVEFDMYENGRNRYPSAFDADPNGILGDIIVPHMAYTFPGNLDKTYQAIDKSLTGNIIDVDDWYTLLGGGKVARIKHQQLSFLNVNVADNVQDGKWYEFNFSFDASTNDFQYYLRNPETGNQTTVVHVPWNDLNAELNLNANNMSAYWGFTAANGISQGNVKIVFAEAPVELDYDLSNYIFNSEGTNITLPPDESNNKLFAKKGDFVTLETDITLSQIDYTSTRALFKGNLNPALFDLSTISKIKVKINDMDLGDVTPTVNKNTGEFSILIPSEVKKKDKIKLSTTVKSNNKSKNEDKTYFYSVLQLTNPKNGSQDYLTSEPGYFWLKYVNSPLNVSWSKDEKINDLVTNSDIAEISDDGYALKFFYDGGTPNSTIQYVLKKKDESIDFGSVQNDANINIKKEQNITIPLSSIKYGDNFFTLEVNEIDSVEKVQMLNFTINVTGSLRLVTAPSSLKWTNRTIGTSKGISTRDSNNVIDLSVQDSRNGSLDDWYLSVNTIKDITTSDFPKINLIWKDLNGVSTTIPDASEGASLKIMDKSNSLIEDKFMNIMHLENNQGALLKSEDYLTIGSYDLMKVQWILNQTYQPD